MKMKILTALTCLLSSSAFASTCTDFSGAYQYAPNPTELTLTVTQDACKSVTFNYLYPGNGETMARTFVTNGKRRMTNEDQNQIIYETAKMVGSQMTNLVEFYEKATNQTTTATSTFDLDANDDLNSIDVYYDVTGKQTSTDTNDFSKAKP
jgi:hypothetical protein